MEEVLINLRKEKMELFGKIRKLEKFRGSAEWEKLSVAHKQLLDIQLQSMKTYLECLIGRVLDIETNSKEENEEEQIVKIVVIDLGDTKENE